MIPRLYESTETDDSTEGLGALRDLISISIPRNRNEIATLTMTYPNNGYLSKTIAEDLCNECMRNCGNDNSCGYRK